MSVFEFENLLEDLFESVCPRHPSGMRATKPLLAPSLGYLCLDHMNPNGRKLVSNRQYNRVDFVDFLDYATTDLPPRPRLGAHTDGRIELFEGFERHPQEPFLTMDKLRVGLSLLDCAIARNHVFVSTTTRFRIFGEGFAEDFLTTMTFASRETPGPSADDSLVEWDRYRIYPPLPKADTEWRFMCSGTYTDHLLSDMEQRGGPGAGTPEQIELMRLSGPSNYEEFALAFEIARLTLCLPSYIDFMYDLVITERRPLRRKAATRRKRMKGKKARRAKPAFRLIRSIHVIRLHPDQAAAMQQRKWKAPSYRFAVRGHWRRLSNEKAMGKDRFGRPIVGKTWIRSFQKYESLGPGTTEIAESEPGVTINIKQTLAYARDLIKSHQQDESGTTGHRASGRRTGSPSNEWQATERAKLSAGLRYSIMKRDDFRCRLCGRTAVTEVIRLEVDHIIPVVAWGRTEERNLQTLCRECNRGKSTDQPSG